MTTILNTSPSGNNTDSGMGIVIGVIVAIILIALFFVYALPALRNSNNAATSASTPANTSGASINLSLPTSAASGTLIATTSRP